jgi:hypothetical protein
MPPKTVSQHNALKSKLSQSYCASYRWNERNLERPWYGLWTVTLGHLTETFDNMVVIPQYPLWYIPDEEDGDEKASVEGDDFSDEEIAGSATDQSRNEEHDIADPDNDPIDLFQYPEERDPDESMTPHVDSCGLPDSEVDISGDSLVTVPDGNASERLPDFVVIHLLAKRLRNSFPRYKSLGGLQITHQCCVLVVENKRHPSRVLKGRRLKASLTTALSAALFDLGYQCYHLFKNYPHATSTIAIAAAGEYWTYRIVYREDVPKPAVDDNIGDLMDVSIWDSLEWPGYVALGTRESDAQLSKIYEMLDKKPKLDLDGMMC